MKKKSWICAAVWCAGLCMTALFSKGQPIAQAKEQDAEKKETVEMRELASRGNLFYLDGGEMAAICAADFTFLEGKLSAVVGTVYDPEEYMHVHQWEYQDADDDSHTRHCVLCGMELTDIHKVQKEEDCTISYGGAEFVGRCYQCVCGYRWEREATHNLVFEIVDETCHQARCLLDGTSYCQGCEFAEEEHYAFYRTPDPAGTHNVKTCIDCGYQTEEEVEAETQTPELPENPEEEEQMPETPEGSEEGTQAPETSGNPEEETQMPETPEGSEEGTQAPEISGDRGEETEKPEQEEMQEAESGEQSGVSVSGNDCAGGERQGRVEKKIRENTEAGGEM